MVARFCTACSLPLRCATQTRCSRSHSCIKITSGEPTLVDSGLRAWETGRMAHVQHPTAEESIAVLQIFLALRFNRIHQLFHLIGPSRLKARGMDQLCLDCSAHCAPAIRASLVRFRAAACDHHPIIALPSPAVSNRVDLFFPEVRKCVREPCGSKIRKSFLALMPNKHNIPTKSACRAKSDPIPKC